MASVLKRLTPDDPESWALWPLLEARVREGTVRMSESTPPDAVIAYLRAFWGTKPAELGAWLCFAPGGEDNGHAPVQVVAHCVGWVESMWGIPKLFVYQLIGDLTHEFFSVRAPMLAELEAWRQGLNDSYVRSGAPHYIRKLRMYTDRPDAYRRFLAPYVETEKGWTLIEFDMETVAVPSEEVS